MIKVLHPGFYTSVQDFGRVGYANIGVPTSGVMDSYAAKLANGILNNNVNDAVIEITFGVCKLAFKEDTVICISGGNFTPKLNGEEITLNTKLIANKEAILSFGKAQFGVRCYVAVKGGILTEKILNSRSFFKGLTSGFLLRKNDELPITPFKIEFNSSTTKIKIPNSHFTSKELLCYKGPEFDLLNSNQKEQLQNMLFTISKDNNRMGYRLEEVLVNNLKSMLTSAVLPGTVQLTPSGKLIILMRDAQVTGGYPRVLQLSATAIDRLSQKTTGNEVEFKIVEG